jgi:DNA-binding LytR/AlgR family response regulator
MKITILESDDADEIEIVLKCKDMNEEVLKILTSLQSFERKIMGTLQGKIYLLTTDEIYYFESVDKKNFAYTKQNVYEVSMRLYQVEEMFGDGNLFRATKSTIINLDKVKTITPRFGGKVEVMLENGENMLVSRQYVPILKERLGF